MKPPLSSVVQFADIANGARLPEQAVCSIDLWTGCIAGGKSVEDWCAFDVLAHVFLATKPI